jgi:Transposase DDE domain group 1
MLLVASYGFIWNDNFIMPSNIATKNQTHLDFVTQAADDVSAFGGAVVIDAIARDSGLWDNFAAAQAKIEHRTDTSRGSTPQAIVSQILFGFATGAVSLAGAGRLRLDTALGKLVGLEKMADADTIGKWLGRQTEESVAAVWEINRRFVDWAWKQLPKESLLGKQGRLACFFDDSQVEVEGRCFEGAVVNYEGKRSYSFQTLWLGQKWIVAGRLDEGSVDCSGHLREILLESKSLWHPYAEAGQAHFYADSGSSAGKYLTIVAQYGWSWSISYNKWTGKLEELAGGEKSWGEKAPAVGRKGEAIEEEHTWLRHQPGEDCVTGHDFATVRYRAAEGGELLYRYAYVVCGQAGKALAPVTKPAEARAVFAQHKMKGEMEHGFSNLLGDLDLHHPPCMGLQANAMWYALGALANNLLRATQALAMPEDQQDMRLRSIIRFWVTTPVKITQHSGRRSARVYVTQGLLRFWSELLAKVWPKRARGGQVANRPIHLETKAWVVPAKAADKDGKKNKAAKGK